MVNLSVVILFLYSINSGFSKENLYTVSDLEVLEKDKNFEEFLQHVNDIRPSARDKHWKEMYQSMGIALIDYKMKIKDYSRTTFNQIEQLGRSVALANDEFYQLKRSIYAKKYFTECYRTITLNADSTKMELERTQCDGEVSSFWYFSKKDPDFGLEIAEILTNNHSGLKLWPFYEMAVKDSIAPFYCQKPKVQEAVLKKLYEESFGPEFNGDYKNLVTRVAPEKCFNELVVTLKTGLTSTKTSGLDKEMAMNLLEARGKLSAEELDFYAVLYLLDGPVVGDKMNMAWKKIEFLGENYEKRVKLLQKITELPLLPDRIFKDPSLPRNKAIINLFAKHFPEFLNFYGSACLKFINHSENGTLNVTSSYQCHEFLKAARSDSTEQSAPWVSDSIKTQYSSLKKF